MHQFKTHRPATCVRPGVAEKSESSFSPLVTRSASTRSFNGAKFQPLHRRQLFQIQQPASNIQNSKPPPAPPRLEYRWPGFKAGEMCGVVGGGGRRGWKFEGADKYPKDMDWRFKRCTHYRWQLESQRCTKRFGGCHFQFNNKQRIFNRLKRHFWFNFG